MEEELENEYLRIEEDIVAALRTVYDTDEKFVTITMTLTAPNCPAADFILEDVRMKVEDVEGVTGVEIQLTFEPEWNKDMMSEEAMLELGFL